MKPNPGCGDVHPPTSFLPHFEELRAAPALPTLWNREDIEAGATKRIMPNQSKLRALIYRPAVYRIRVFGVLDPAWSDRLQGMKVSIIQSEQHPDCTELSGWLADQAALMGVLQELYNCGIPLLHVECVGGAPCRI